MNGKIDFIKFCRVIDVDDENGADRVYATVMPEDNSKEKTTENIKDKGMWAIPLLPKMFRVLPKVGEGVFVLFASSEVNSQRYYIGPIISQDHKLYNEPIESSLCYARGSYTDFDRNERNDSSLCGVFPKQNDVFVRGRKNADIQITDDDIKLRAGVKVCDEEYTENIKFNNIDPSFIKLKYHKNLLLNDEVKSTATIVADKINLFGNQSTDPEIEINNSIDDGWNDELIKDDKLDKLMQDAYRLPYGEKLVEILKEIIKVLRDHTHPFPMKPPYESFFDKLNNQESILLDKEQLLSNSIRIN